MSNKPETVFKVGAVRASVFQNVISHQGREVVLPKVVLEVRYKDKTGQWQGTNSFSLNELPKAILALQKAFEHLTSRPVQDDQPASVPSSAP
jgi:hypothetical protein